MNTLKTEGTEKSCTSMKVDGRIRIPQINYYEQNYKNYGYHSRTVKTQTKIKVKEE